MKFVTRLKEVEHEHGHLKQMHADLLLEHASLNGGRCPHLVIQGGLSVQRARRVVGTRRESP